MCKHKPFLAKNLTHCRWNYLGFFMLWERFPSLLCKVKYYRNCEILKCHRCFLKETESVAGLYQEKLFCCLLNYIYRPCWRSYHTMPCSKWGQNKEVHTGFYQHYWTTWASLKLKCGLSLSYTNKIGSNSNVTNKSTRLVSCGCFCFVLFSLT